MYPDVAGTRGADDDHLPKQLSAILLSDFKLRYRQFSNKIFPLIATSQTTANMLKRKAEFVGLGQAINGSKKIKQEAEKFEKSSLLDDSDSTSSDDSDGGAKLGDDFKINEEFAKRFEYNKKREEIHRRESIEHLEYMD